MRKFLVAAALLAVAACGEKKAAGADSVATAPSTPAMAQDSAKADTMKKDSMNKMMTDSGAMKKDTVHKPS